MTLGDIRILAATTCLVSEPFWTKAGQMCRRVDRLGFGHGIVEVEWALGRITPNPQIGTGGFRLGMALRCNRDRFFPRKVCDEVSRQPD
jgi:hypothetical protein